MPLHDAFDAIADAYPHRVALVDGASEVTYAELRDRADRCARGLAQRGVGPEWIVGVHLHRSVDLIVALLGVVKAGGAYLPLPPEQPEDRLRWLVDDAGAQLVLTAAAGGELFGRPALRVDEAAGGAGPPVVAPTGGNLACVIYTSGSTGRPKAVGITHANLRQLVTGQHYVNFAPTETFLQLAPISFDASAFEIWGAMLSGARLIIAAPSYQAIDDLPDTLRRGGVTTLLLTPPLFHELFARGGSTFAGVSRLIVGGDAMSVPVARRYAADARRRGATFANVYGPTETTVLVTCADIVELGPDDTIPIGGAIIGAAIYLLDENLDPVGVGDIGELHIGGRGVTRGYLHQPGLTADRFRPDPYAAEPGRRMYASGDLGRRRADGGIDFCGRSDRQVKVRGFRIEPGEIESVLADRPGVAVAAVVAESTTAGPVQLVAYVTSDREVDDGWLEGLRDHVARTLPSHLVPSVFRHIARVPLTGSGKIDHAGLAAAPLVEPTRRTAASPAAGPSAAGVASPGATEPSAAGLSTSQAALTQVWMAVLGRDRIELDDDFFALGGDSILAIRAIVEAEAAGVPVSLVELFQRPTIRLLTESAGASEPEPGPANDILIPEDAGDLPEFIEYAYPASRLQQGLIFEAMFQDESLYHDVITRRIDRPFDEAALRRALDAVTARHEALRTSINVADYQTALQLVSYRVELPLTVTDRRGRDASAALQADLSHAGEPFDLEHAPLLRVAVTVLTDDAFQLTYGFHHAIMDGWSETVFATEVLGGYLAYSHGDAPRPAGPLPRMAEFVQREREAVESGPAQTYWTARTAELPAVAAAVERSPRRLRQSLPVVDGPTGQRLVDCAGELRVPLKSIVLAAHLAAMGAMVGTARPVTGLVTNGRLERPGGDRMIGLFLNVVPFAVAVRTDPVAFVREVFESERGLLPYRRFPYAEIKRIAGHSLYDVTFNYVHFHLEAELQAVSGPPEIHDKISLPLSVEAIQHPVDDSLRLDFSADAARWTGDDLRRLCALHREMLDHILANAPLPSH